MRSEAELRNAPPGQAQSLLLKEPDVLLVLAQHKQESLLRLPPSVGLGGKASRWKVSLVFWFRRVSGLP